MNLKNKEESNKFGKEPDGKEEKESYLLIDGEPKCIIELTSEITALSTMMMEKPYLIVCMQNNLLKIYDTEGKAYASMNVAYPLPNFWNLSFD